MPASPDPLPDCPHCSAADTLSVEWTEMGTQHCVCSCCAKPCRVDDKGHVHKAEPRQTDVSGNQMYE